MIAVDTNLLIYAHREGLREHRAARRALDRAANAASGWGFAQTSVVEFWCVGTHPAASGRPSAATEASRFLTSLMREGGAQLWLPGPGFGERLPQLATRLDVLRRSAASFVVPLSVYASTLALIHGRMPASMRSTTVGFTMMLLNVLAIAAGNLAAGSASDHMTAQGHPAPLTTVLIAMDCVLALALVCYLVAARLIARERRPSPLDS